MPILSNAANPVTIYFGADYRADNPYQQLLYASVGGGFHVRSGLPQDALDAARKRSHRAIYHLHWEEHVLKQAEASEAAASAASFCETLTELQKAGVPIVWTRHNSQPHAEAYHSLHLQMVSHLADVADCIHVHGPEARNQLYGNSGATASKLVVINHGNYEGCYPHWSRRMARETLELPQHCHVFLLFGRLATYKGVRDAIDAFRSVPKSDAMLLLAGRLNDPDIETEISNDPRIKIAPQKVPDSHVGCFFAASDTVLLPYRESLTSGTVMLAATMGRAVLGYDCAGLREVITTPDNGVLIDRSSLASNMQKAIEEGRDQWRRRGDKARQTALAQDWQTLGRQWRDVFQEVLPEI